MALFALVLPVPRRPYRQWMLAGQFVVIEEYHVHSTRDLFDRLKIVEHREGITG